MNKFYIHIVTDGSVVLSTLPTSMREHADNCGCGYRRYDSDILGENIAELKEGTDGGYLYICSGDRNITRKIMQHYFDALKVLHDSYKVRLSEMKVTFVNDFRRLQHNISTYNNEIANELTDLFPVDGRQQEWRETVEDVENVVREKPRNTAFVLLRTYKNTSLINSEMIVHELMKSDYPHLEIYPHQIHSVVKLSFQPYFLEFLEKRIVLHWSDCHDKVAIDYPSISVALGHIWNNAIKYARENSTINISFYSEASSVEICIGMMSLYIEESEREHLHKDGYSGKWAKIMNKDGHGIGMYYIKKLIELNGGTFMVECGNAKNYVDGVPYAWNVFILRLNKAA